jgi:hypothetical protein
VTNRGEEAMTSRQEKVWESLVGLDGETVLRLFVDYHGMGLMDDGFLEHVASEGFVDEDEEEEE